MENLNNAFFFVVDKIIDLQGFFIDRAKEIGSLVLLIAILTAALNYALTGTGLRENVIKIMKATAFFLIVVFLYPKIIGFITSWTFKMARDSIGPNVQEYYADSKAEIGALADRSSGSGKIIEETSPDNPSGYFGDIIREINHPQMTYHAIPPASLTKIILLIAGDCIKFSDNAGRFEFGKALKGLICAFFIIATGVFAILEYLMAFLEFTLVSSVGVILFPLSIWEGSKFMSEKFIGAILGFFIKLLFCNVTIFLLLYGFITLAHQFARESFGGRPDEIISVVFICLLFFYICKSAPGLAQGLLTGAPSLSATGAISAVGGMVAAAGATMGMAKNTGGKIAGGVAGGIAKGVFAAQGALSEAGAAAGAVSDHGGSKSNQVGAFFSSIGGSTKDAFSAGGLGLVRSLTGGSNSGENPYSWQDHFNKGVDKSTGEQLSFRQYSQERKAEGAHKGLEYLSRKTGTDYTEPDSAGSA